MTEQQAEQQWHEWRPIIAGDGPEYLIHRWTKNATSGEYEQMFDLFGERAEVKSVCDYLNALEAKLQVAVEALEYVKQYVEGNFNGDDLEALRRIVPRELSKIAALQSIKEQGR